MARELAPAGPRSGPKKRTAAQSSGSKLPRHNFTQRSLYLLTDRHSFDALLLSSRGQGWMP
ncbi:hypothetical protein EI534_22260 [Pseudomonas frederiksbergensis]|nr:hypothetical protein [Pseudomonas frederiksbergensis]